MAIPKLEVPTYELTIPSSGKKIRYRPFLVKEHKTLLMVSQGTDEEATRIIEEIVDVCTFGKLNIASMPDFDLEYIFMHLRAKALGESLDLIVNCKSCGAKVDFSIDLAKVNIKRSEKHSNKFLINDSIGVEMRYPKYQKDHTIQDSFERALNCVKAIWTSDGQYHEVTTDDIDELAEFLNSMSFEQFNKIKQFFETMPKLTHLHNVECPSCKTINAVKVEGLINFFV